MVIEIENTQVGATTKKRHPLIALVLSLLLPGLGQIYNGQAKKAFLFFILLMFFPFLFGLTRGFTYFYGLVILVIIELSIRIYAMVDAFRHAKIQKEYIPKKYNTWYYHLFIAILMISILIIFDTSSRLRAVTYKIPTTSNQPTINSGDWIVCDTKAYTQNSPNYGDMVAFKSQLDGKIYCYRVIGLPNDVLSFKNHTVMINRKECKTNYIGTAISDDRETLEFEEVLPNGYKHRFYKLQIPLDSSIANIDSIYVPPPNNYFLLGDNRDNAFDSRYFGPVNKDDIIGRIVYSYWGKTTKRINISFRDK